MCIVYVRRTHLFEYHVEYDLFNLWIGGMIAASSKIGGGKQLTFRLDTYFQTIILITICLKPGISLEASVHYRHTFIIALIIYKRFET